MIGLVSSLTGADWSGHIASALMALIQRDGGIRCGWAVAEIDETIGGFAVTELVTPNEDA